MFATPFTAPLHQALATHVFGRFMPARTAAAAGQGEAAAPVPMAAPAHGTPNAAPDDDAWPDLAQRVRDVGEW
ncbi:hypothetical protein [Paracidovorax sp. MALMAid1276]|uniref:hypothetical protein n=1 Tax=Paracidovorax sp. MALMAid1276 TaxID=3411631 RepID=UPI003B9BC26C